MQNAKDSFYEALRTKLVALNPYRTLVLRGVVRPGLIVEENELVSTTALPDCFRMRWTGSVVNADGPLTLIALGCEVAYETAGTATNGGMDRGRLLATMDAELQAAVNPLPRTASKMNFAGLASGAAAVAMTTNVWWSEVTFGQTVMKDNRLSRTATLTVMAYQEAGEL